MTSIEVKNLNKKYKTGLISINTFYEEFSNFIYKFFSKKKRMLFIKEKTFHALKNISFKIEQGERVGIIGLNGAGKSTLLKIISRITSPSSGEINLYGKVSSMLEVGTGFHSELTGRENIYLNGAILGMSKKEVETKIESIIDFSECGTFIDTPVKRYSSGMYVKLAFSVAAHLNSDILIMDEVLAVGDIAFQRKCLNKMTELSNNSNKTVLYVSHNMNTIRSFCTRCIVLEQGEIIFDGDIEKAIVHYFNSKENETAQTVNFNSYKRTDPLANGKALITNFEFKENKNHIFELGSYIKAILKFKCIQTIDDVYLRIIINSYEGTPCGSAMTSSGIKNCIKKTEKELEFCLDARSISPGKYKMTLILFHPDGYGGQEKFDAVYNAVNFEIISTKEKLYNFYWSKNWGTAIYPSIELTNNYEYKN